MAGSRRIQRSVRVSLSVALMGVAVLVVGVAVATSVLVAPAAVLGLLAGVGSTRVMYAEVVQTRWEAARQRAEHARSYQAAMDRNHTDHLAYTAMMSRRLVHRDRAIGELGGTMRLLERRVEDAESRVRREARRANESQERLAAVLDEVLGTGAVDADDMGSGSGSGALAGSGVLADGVEADLFAERGELPTVVDLLGWDAKAAAAAAARSAEAAPESEADATVA